MKFVAFEGRDKRAVYINPALVTLVREINERSSLICFGQDHSVEVTLQANVVVEDLQRAASTG
jgi:hypothetical protein